MVIISGGQTGVDRAALDAAIALGINHGGWCPKGRLAEDGTIDIKYNLKETTTEKYPQRTDWNVRDSDGTLIISNKKSSRGTSLTIRCCNSRNKPVLSVNPDSDEIATSLNGSMISKWIKDHNIKVLNVAGPRESSSQGIYDKSFQLLTKVFTKLLE